MRPIFFLALLTSLGLAAEKMWSVVYDPGVTEVRFAASEIRRARVAQRAALVEEPLELLAAAAADSVSAGARTIQPKRKAGLVEFSFEGGRARLLSGRTENLKAPDVRPTPASFASSPGAARRLPPPRWPRRG